MYVNIAICDDEIAICHQLEQHITEIFSSAKIDYNIEIYTSGDKLCEELKSENFDLIFLDIELPGINGIEIGSFIRDTLHNEAVQIVYISAVQSYAMELFYSRPMNFLVKPISYSDVNKVIKTFLRLYQEKEMTFTFKVNGHFYKVAVSDILYFESHKRKVTVITSTGSYDFYDTLKNIQKQLSLNEFILIHQSILVNFNHIKFFEYDSVTMIDGTTLPVSQSRRSQVKKDYLNLIKGELYD